MLQRSWQGRCCLSSCTLSFTYVLPAQVELQGVSLVVLSFFRDLDAATELANTVAAAGGIMGAAVCCAENGGDPNDDWTTCDSDRDVLLDRSVYEAFLYEHSSCYFPNAQARQKERKENLCHQAS